jgi:trans-aconitate 2-methyltransferase
VPAQQEGVVSRWDPDSYLKFERERTLPSRDLVSRIQLTDPRKIIDIGCGPGNSTSVLREAWPDADVIGLDNSEEMIAKAQSTSPSTRWIIADAAEWRSGEAYDLVFSNATLHWIADQERVLGNLFDQVAEEGALAVQVPFNTESPLYKSLVNVSESAEWNQVMAGCSAQIFYRDEFFYYSLLSRLSARIEMWITTYLHVMESHQDLIDWYSSTGMKMYLERIGTEEKRVAFKSQILEACKPQYPFQHDGKILFPFKRIFFVAYKAR